MLLRPQAESQRIQDSNSLCFRLSYLHWGFCKIPYFLQTSTPFPVWKKEPNLFSQTLTPVREWLSAEIFQKFSLLWILVREESNISKALTPIFFQNTDAPSHPERCTVLFWKCFLEIRYFFQSQTFFPTTSCCALEHVQAKSWKKWMKGASLSYPPSQSHWCAPLGDPVLFLGIFCSKCSPIIWPLSTELSLKDYAIVTKDVMYVRECKHFRGEAFSLYNTGS